MKRRFSSCGRSVNFYIYLKNRGSLSKCLPAIKISVLGSVLCSRCTTSSHLHQTAPCVSLHVSRCSHLTRHMRCSTHMHAFFTKRKMYSRLRYIIFASAAAPNSVVSDAPIAFSSRPTGSPSVQKQSSRCCCTVVRGRPAQRSPTDAKLKMSGAAPHYALTI